jgi:hypothetical protein
MWQLEIEATYASSGSTFAGFEYGTFTDEGAGDAGTVTPPSNVHVRIAALEEIAAGEGPLDRRFVFGHVLTIRLKLSVGRWQRPFAAVLPVFRADVFEHVGVGEQCQCGFEAERPRVVLGILE